MCDHGQRIGRKLTIIFWCLIMFLHWNLSLFVIIMRIFLYLWSSWESFPIDDHHEKLLFYKFIFYLWNLFKIFYLWESIFYENKPAYECHHLKQIFCHQRMIKIFCWFRLFQAYNFWLEFFSFCVSLFSWRTKCFSIH